MKRITGNLVIPLILLSLLAANAWASDCLPPPAATAPPLEDLGSAQMVGRVTLAFQEAGLLPEQDVQPDDKALSTAIKAYQKKHGLFPDGEISELLLIRLEGLPKLQPDSLFANAASGRLSASAQQLAADPNLNARDANGWTPLLYATLNGDAKTVTSLLKAGAEVDLTSPYGTHPLMVAVYRNNPQILKLLLDQWPDLELPDHQGRIAEEVAFKQNRQGLLSRFRLHRETMKNSQAKRRPPFKARLITWDWQVCYQARMSRIEVDCQIDHQCPLERNQLLLCHERGKPYFADLTRAVQQKWGGKPLAVDGREGENPSQLRCREGDIVLMGVR